MPSSEVLVSFGGHSVKVISDHSLIAKTLQAHFRYCNWEQTEVIAALNVSTISKTKFKITVSDRDLFQNLGYEQALRVTMNEVITHLNANCVRGLVFHAAALATDKNAIILCGKSGSGKSSLAAWLTAEGFYYLSDEVIEIPIQGNSVHGLARSIVLKPDSAFIWQYRLPDKDAQGFITFEDGSAWIEPDLFHPNGVTNAAVPHTIIFPQFTPEASLHTKKLTDGETLFRLLQTLVNARNLPGHGMDSAAQLAGQVIAFDLIYSEIEEAADWIKQTITQ